MTREFNERKTDPDLTWGGGHAMRIDGLEVKNIRCFEQYCLPLAPCFRCPSGITAAARR